VYYFDSIYSECEVYSGSINEMMKCIVPADSRQLPRRSKLYWLDWCFQNLHDEVDYSLVQLSANLAPCVQLFTLLCLDIVPFVSLLISYTLVRPEKLVMVSIISLPLLRFCDFR
jgi:hypothetical protein